MNWLFFLLILFNFQASSNELWQKAVEMVEKSKEYIPEKMVYENIVYNLKGVAFSKFNVIFNLSLNEKEELIMEPVKITLNERDVTKEYKEKIIKTRNESEMEYLFSNKYDIFLQENQNYLNYYPSGEEKIKDFNYSVFTFFQRIKNIDRLQKGFVYLNSQSGKPYKIVYTLDPLPSNIDEMSISIYYSENYKEIALPERIEIFGFGKIQLFGYQASLSFKSKFKINFLFSDYFLPSKKTKK